MKKWKIGGIIIALVLSIPLTLKALSPPAPDIHINGHIYTDADWNANAIGTLSAIANDIGAITSLYPAGRFSPRVVLTSDLVMYVDPAGSDTNNCLVSHPCQTVQRPFDVLRDGYDQAGWIVTVQLADGGYTQGLKLRGRFIGQQSPASLVLKGNSGSPSSVTISDPTVPTDFFERGDGTAIYANWGAMLTVDGVKLTAGFRCMWANSHSEIRFLNVEVGNCDGVQLEASNAAILRLRGNYKITGSATTAHVRANHGGIVYLSDTGDPEISPVITIEGSPAITIFADARRRGEIIALSSQTTFSGAPAAGTTKFSVMTLGLIDSNGSGVGYFPGTVPGLISTATGGVYN